MGSLSKGPKRWLGLPVNVHLPCDSQRIVQLRIHAAEVVEEVVSYEERIGSSDDPKVSSTSRSSANS